MTNKTPKAIFLDRDGTLIRDKNYLSQPKDIEYFPDTFEALQLMQTKGYQLYVITNQSGVGRGFFTLQDVTAVHRAMEQDLVQAKLSPYAGWGVCPHAPDQGCQCRKPFPKLILDFIQRDQLDPAQCWMLGDKGIDAECGINAGIRGGVVREKNNAGPYDYYDTLLAFAQQL